MNNTLSIIEINGVFEKEQILLKICPIGYSESFSGIDLLDIKIIVELKESQFEANGSLCGYNLKCFVDDIDNIMNKKMIHATLIEFTESFEINLTYMNGKCGISFVCNTYLDSSLELNSERLKTLNEITQINTEDIFNNPYQHLYSQSDGKVYDENFFFYFSEIQLSLSECSERFKKLLNESKLTVTNPYPGGVDE